MEPSNAFGDYQTLSNLINSYLKQHFEADQFIVDDKKKRKEILDFFQNINETVTTYLVGVLDTLKTKLEKLHSNFLNDLDLFYSSESNNGNPPENIIKVFCNKYMPLLRHYNFFLFGYALTSTEISSVENFHPELTITEIFPPFCEFNYEIDILDKDDFLKERFSFFKTKINDNTKISLLSFRGLILINEYLHLFKYPVISTKKNIPSTSKSIDCKKSEKNIEKMKLLFKNTANYLLPEIKYEEQNKNNRSIPNEERELSDYHSHFNSIYVTTSDELNTSSLLLAYILVYEINLSVISQISYCAEDGLDGQQPLPDGQQPLLPDGQQPLPEGQQPLPEGQQPLPEGQQLEELEDTTEVDDSQRLEVIPYLNDDKDAVTTLCNNLLMTSGSSDNILTIENSTSLEMYAYGYTEGFLTKDDLTSTIRFDYTKFTTQFASIHAFLEKGHNDLYLYVLNLLCLLFNSASINSVVISHMINGDINIILSELVINLSDKAYEIYYDSLDQSITVNWDPKKKKMKSKIFGNDFLMQLTQFYQILLIMLKVIILL